MANKQAQEITHALGYTLTYNAKRRKYQLSSYREEDRGSCFTHSLEDAVELARFFAYFDLAEDNGRLVSLEGMDAYAALKRFSKDKLEE